MTLRNVLFLLATCLFLPSVKAMEKPIDEVTLEDVTVRFWKRQELRNGKKVGAQMSLQTKKHYISYRPSSDLIEEEEKFHLQKKGEMRTLKDFRDSVAPSSFEIDQKIQDKKRRNKDLKVFEPFACLEKCPCETYTLSLDAKSMDVMWEEITNNAEPIADGLRLKNVMYMRKWVQTLMKHSKREEANGSDQTPVLYFSKADLIKGLLLKGKIYNTSIFPQKSPKYFMQWLNTMPDEYSSWDDVIKNNNHMKYSTLKSSEVMDWVWKVHRQQELYKIHRDIESRNMPYLNECHEQVILKILFMNSTATLEARKKEITEYLDNSQTRYSEEQSYFSLEGWKSWARGEWKKGHP